MHRSHPLRILLADDSRSMRALIRTAFPFAHPQPEFHEVANGRDAVEAYTARRFDIVLLDIRMPVIDGLEALEAIRDYDEDAFVLMVSGEDTRENRDIATQAGAIGFVAKPISQQVALQILQIHRERGRRPVSVLAVDESDDTLTTLKYGLEILNLPHRMYGARTAAQARHSFRSAYFDLVFLDSHLPGGDGLRVLADIKAQRAGTHVVMFTNESTVEAVRRARDAGADDYLLKSVDLAQLRKVWDRFLAASPEFHAE